MGTSVTLPLWLFVLLAALAGWTLVRAVRSVLRWIVRRRNERVLEQVGARLQLALPVFKLTRRQALIERLFHDPGVQAAAARRARETGEPLADVRRRVDRYAQEIVPSFNAYLYFRIGYAVARALVRAIYRVRVGHVDDAAFARVSPQSSIVFVINHRSNMDYILVAFLAAERAAISYAVGEWARVWPLQQLLRAMGAYFVRRNSGDALYRTVLARYVQMATEAGVTQAVFPEGGLTVDGRLRAPRFGLLDYMLKTFDAGGERDLVFVPVGLNYDRVLEDRSQLLRLDAEATRRHPLFGAATALRFVLSNLWLLVTGRWHRLGYACVNFGAPISMREHARAAGLDFPKLDEAARHAEVTSIAARLMEAIGRIVPVTPVSLAAAVFVDLAGSACSELELKALAHARLRELEAGGAHLYVPRQDLDYAVGVGLRMLRLRRLVTEQDGLLRVAPGEEAALAYYANAIAHLERRPPTEG